MRKRVRLIILDGVEIGALLDAAGFGDEFSHMLGNSNDRRSLMLSNLYGIGLGDIENARLTKEENPIVVYCRLAEKAKAKDTTSGHWEIVRLPLKIPFRTRKNFASQPPEETILVALLKNNIPLYMEVGKIEDSFANHGIPSLT